MRNGMSSDVALNRRSRDRFIERDRLRDPRRRYDRLDRFERLRLGDLDGIFLYCHIFFFMIHNVSKMGVSSVRQRLLTQLLTRTGGGLLRVITVHACRAAR